MKTKLDKIEYNEKDIKTFCVACDEPLETLNKIKHYETHGNYCAKCSSVKKKLKKKTKKRNELRKLLNKLNK